MLTLDIQPLPEVRHYPQLLSLSPELSSRTLLSFLNLPNLTSLVWTRDKSLTPALLAAVEHNMPRLRTLEINAHSQGAFDPESLVRIRRLKALSLILPDRGVIAVLGRWLKALWDDKSGPGDTGRGLERLSILCQVRSVRI